MKARPGSSRTGTWLLLVGLTVLAWWLAERQAVPPPAALPAVLLMAAAKVRLVARHFMELDSAPLRWRLLLDAWLAAVIGILAAGAWAAAA